MNKEQFLEKIQLNIERFGFHVTLVSSHTSPRYIYTIGLTEKFNFELIFAGGIYYLKKQAFEIIDKIVAEVIKRDGTFFETVDLADLGTFSIGHVDRSWSTLLMLGVYDYYKLQDANAFQIIPDSDHSTLDVPDMSNMFDADQEPIWQWEMKQWDINVPENSTVGTTLNILMGAPITELTRWEEDYWEMFSDEGPDKAEAKRRFVSIGTILAIDPTIKPALNLPLEKGLIRDSKDDEWVNWD